MISSPPDIILILGIALLVFGPKRLPELGKALGQGIGNFKKSMVDAEQSLQASVQTASTLPVSNCSEPVSSINAESSDKPKT